MTTEVHAKNFFDLAAGYRSEKSRSSHHRPGLDWLAPVAETNRVSTPSHDALLVGPADRYSIGDLLRPHVLTRVLNFSRFRCAGPFGTDMTESGGFSVRNFGESALELTGSRLQIVHFGGDTLSMSLAESYQSAAAGAEAERFASLLEIGSPEQIEEYAQRRSGQLDSFGYVLAPEGEFYSSQTSFHAVGLSDPGALSSEARDRLLQILAGASFVGIRDENGADYLEKEGIRVHRMPCALTVLPQVCARRLRESRDCDALEAMRHRFPNGWIAVETSSVLRSDSAKLAAALGAVATREDIGLVFFDAEDATKPQRKAGRREWVEAFPEWMAAEFPSTNIWDVASLLLHSRLYCGGNLDCRIICMSGGVARINLPVASTSVESYCELWEHDEVPIRFSDLDHDWEEALEEALRVDLSLLQQHAKSLHDSYFDSLELYCRETGIFARLARSGRDLLEAMDGTRVLHRFDDDSAGSELAGHREEAARDTLISRIRSLRKAPTT